MKTTEIKAATTTCMESKMEALYTEAGKVIDAAKNKKGSIKGLCFASTYRNKKKLYALVCQTIKYKSMISKLLEKLENDDQENMLDDSMRLVLAYEILFGQGIRCGGKSGVFAKENKQQLFELLEEFQNDGRYSEETAKNSFVSLPRFVRVNTLKTNSNDVIKIFEKEGWRLVERQGYDLNDDEFSQDNHIPNVLIFNPGTDFHRHPLYLEGKILLQDKASCLPAFLLKPKLTSTVIDACAAPGNKTTHLSAIMENQGKIFAFDLDKKRLKLLKEQIGKAGTQNIKAMHQDFLMANRNDEMFRSVEYILLDPSCSGSGMVSRMDELLQDENENFEKLQLRLKALSKFQYAMLCHALSFPSVKKVAYSTCSIHAQENEMVVERALKRFDDKFSLLDLMPSWEHRGLDSFEFGSSCLRASPEVDKTNGFFVAVFKRKEKTPIRQNVGENKEAKFEVETKNQTKKSRKRKKCEDRQMENEKDSCKRKHGNHLSGKKKRRKRELKRPVTS